MLFLIGLNQVPSTANILFMFAKIVNLYYYVLTSTEVPDYSQEWYAMREYYRKDD